MAIKPARIVIPADAGISSMPGQGLQKDPVFLWDDQILGLLGCRSKSSLLMAILRRFFFGLLLSCAPPMRGAGQQGTKPLSHGQDAQRVGIDQVSGA